MRSVSPKRLEEISRVAFTGVDEIMGFPTSWTLGFSVGRPGDEPGAPTTAFGMQGIGGSAAYADPATGVAFALTKNRFNPTEASAAEQIAEIVTKTLA
jgi:CubicO group peptidase (beta-lactamase class C family)